MNVKDAFAKLRTSPWIVACVLGAIIAIFVPMFPDGFGNRVSLSGWAIAWAGACFKAISGGLIAHFFIRRVLRLNISDLGSEQNRAIAGVGAAILMAAFVYAITVGS